MTTLSHYREAEKPFRRAEAGSRASAGEVATAQSHALLAIAEELRNIRNELIALSELTGQLR
jgi:hypothetical protein